MTEFTTESGMVVRSLTPEDAERYFEGLQYMASDFGKDTVYQYPTIESVRESITTPSNPNRERFGIWVPGCVENQGFAGSINLTPQSPETYHPHTGEVGYWLDVRYAGRGVMTAAVKAIARYGLQDRVPVYDGLIAHVLPDNKRSQRVLARAGFELVEPARNDYYYRLDRTKLR